ncbi:dihydropteroate synthase [Flavisolibacter ginsenosidimutans]|uniref:dihydropteroate synthase n=1 Tax=Flavisolibacter ginsenosidimutans TaxID=661481 RepID=A0A5B8UEB6_9BACT|nr:dihydropteroate synthase [Flavisolibacter ginsenosidimutans]QEC54695.1 dihydropteroate synthase [Flavisolibacter ginsenosidimutans]
MFTLNCKGRILTINEPVVMGILNLTPDSFYAGSRLNNEDALLHKAEEMISSGAAILDIGGQSTRPASQRISEEEELKRVVPAVEALHKNFPGQVLSIDTFYAGVATEAVNAGASMINDVSAGTIDPNLLPTVAALNVPYVLMHMRGNPQTMQKNATYQNVTLEVFDSLSFRIKELERTGIKDIIVDPGFGFGKTIQHNFQLLRELSFFAQLEKPLMVGLSRKATVYKTLQTTADKALNGTTVLHTMALLNGANILRVHDVKEAKEATELYLAYKG